MSSLPRSQLSRTVSTIPSMRLAGDFPADAAVAAFFESSPAVANQWMKEMIEEDGLPEADLPAAIQDRLSGTLSLPAWADRGVIDAGEALFRRHGPRILSTLLCYSVPFCYAARSNVQALALTARLYSSPVRHAIETARLAIEVLRPGGLEPDGPGIYAVQKVRLTHAALRWQIAHHPGWSAALGVPLNQEDMAGALTAVSWIVTEGLARAGLELSAGEREAYLHCWSVAGFLLGVVPELLPDEASTASEFANHFARRQFAPSPEGRYMTAALIAMLQHLAPGSLFDGVPGLLIRCFLGDVHADMLGVGPFRPPAVLLEPIEMAAGSAELPVRDADDMARLHEIFSRVLVEGLRWTGRGANRAPFSIPAELSEAWGIRPC